MSGSAADDGDPATDESDPATNAGDETSSGVVDESEQSAAMARNWVQIAAVIAGLVLLALALLQATGLVGVLYPVAQTEGGQWLAFAILAVLVLAFGLWGKTTTN